MPDSAWEKKDKIYADEKTVLLSLPTGQMSS